MQKFHPQEKAQRLGSILIILAVENTFQNSFQSTISITIALMIIQIIIKKNHENINCISYSFMLLKCLNVLCALKRKYSKLYFYAYFYLFHYYGKLLQ